jgi:hypothetical protein
MPSNRRTDFAAFVLDLLDFMENKIREARTTEAHGRRRSARPPAPSRCCATD